MFSWRGGKVERWKTFLFSWREKLKDKKCSLYKFIIRASPSVGAKNFPFCISKIYFFYFTPSFLQNTHISLSILHSYLIKYSFFYIFYYFLTHGLSFWPNHRHHHLATIKSKPRSFYLLCAFFVSHSHGWSEPKPRPIQAET